MTVASEACGPTSLAWTGVETSFTPGWQAQSTVAVRVDYLASGGDPDTDSVTLSEGVHYRVVLADGSGMVTVLPLSMPPAPATLTFSRYTSAVQPTDFGNLAKFLPSTHTQLHDASALRDAEMRRDLDGAITRTEAGLADLLAKLQAAIIGAIPGGVLLASLVGNNSSSVPGTSVKDALDYLLAHQTSIASLDVPRVVPHANFAYFKGNILRCPAPGQAVHDVDLNKWFDRDYGGLGGFLGAANDAGIPDWTRDVLVTVNGNDTTGNGRPSAPFRTARKALQYVGTNGLGSIWLDTGVYNERLNLQGTDATTPGGARSVKIRALNGRGSVLWCNHLDQQPWQMGFTSLGSGTYSATPSGSSSVQQIIWRRTDTKSGETTYTALPIMSLVGNVAALGLGWYQDNTTRLLTINVQGMDFTQAAVQNQFFICYYTGGTQYNSLNGTRIYLEGIEFVGSASLGVFWQAGQPTMRPVLYAKDCGFRFCDGNGIHPEGCDIYTQNLEIQGCGNGDGLNYYPDVVGGSNARCVGLEVDNDIFDTGQVSKFGPSARNCQASSGHSGIFLIQINGNYRHSFGQNIAHVGASTYYWCVGGQFVSPFAPVTGSPPVIDGYDNVYLEGVAWMDTCFGGGIGSLRGLNAAPGSNVKLFNSSFKGSLVDILGTVGTYTPAAP